MAVFISMIVSVVILFLLVFQTCESETRYHKDIVIKAMEKGYEQVRDSSGIILWKKKTNGSL